MMAYTTSVAGTAITASWANASVRDQGVSVFTDSTARGVAITVPVDGMITNLTTTDRVDVYNGASWSALSAPSNGALTSWTPVVVQGATPTLTNTHSTWHRTGRLVYAQFLLAITGAGTAANVVTISLPVNNSGVSSSDVCGYAYINDSSAGLWYHGGVQVASASTVRIMSTTATTAGFTALGSSVFTAALASGDSVSGFLMYEAAADG